MVQDISGLCVVDAAYQQIGLGGEPVGSLMTYGQWKSVNDWLRSGCDSTNTVRSHMRLAEADARTIGIHESIKIVESNLVRIDNGDLL